MITDRRRYYRKWASDAFITSLKEILEALASGNLNSIKD